MKYIVIWDNEFHGNHLSSHSKLFECEESMNEFVKQLITNVYAENIRGFKIDNDIDFSQFYPNEDDYHYSLEEEMKNKL
jgi:hypothetical protein